MKHGYMRGHKEAAGAYGLDKADKVKINAKNPFAHRKMARAKEVTASHKGSAA